MGKFWQIDGQLSNSPMLSPANVSRHTLVTNYNRKWLTLNAQTFASGSKSLQITKIKYIYLLVALSECMFY